MISTRLHRFLLGSLCLLMATLSIQCDCKNPSSTSSKSKFPQPKEPDHSGDLNLNDPMVRKATENGYANLAKVLSKISTGQSDKLDTYDYFISLQEALKLQDQAIIQKLLTQSTSLHQKGYLKATPLNWAAAKGNMDVVKLLLENNPSLINISNYDDPLCLAVEANRKDIVEFLLKKGAKLYDQTGRSHTTALLEAIRNDNVDIIKLLLEKDISLQSIQLADSNGNTPLHRAVDHSNLDIVNLLLTKQAAVNATNNEGDTPLSLAIKKGNQPIIQLLHKRIKQQDPTFTDLHWAALQGDQEAAEKFLQENAGKPDFGINSQDQVGNTPLHLAAKQGKDSIVRLLLNNGANSHVINQQGHTAYTLAKNHKKIQDLLQVTDQSDEKRLFTAIITGKINEVQKLIEDHPKLIDGHTIEGKPLWHVAIENGQKKIVELLLNNYTVQSPKDLTMLELVIGKGELDIVKLLLENYKDVNNKDTAHLLVLAIQEKEVNMEIINLLLDHKPEMTNQELTIALFQAIRTVRLQSLLGQEPKMEIVKLLLDKGPDLNFQMPALPFENPKILLIEAIYSQNAEIVKLLLEKGAPVDTRDDKGNTPLHEAANSKNKEIVQLLLGKGASKTARNNAGHIPADEAKDEDIDIKTLLQP